jgi:Mg-chelatase subunit ChlD
MSTATPDVLSRARWRLLLGAAAGDSSLLSTRDREIDAVLAALYGDGGASSSRLSSARRQGGTGDSAPRVAQWLGDIRTYFPASVVEVLQRDAIDRIGLNAMLMQPKVLETITPDVHLAAALVGLNKVMPEEVKATARQVVSAVVNEVEARIGQHTRDAVAGALARSTRTRNPRRVADINWGATIRANLKNYLREQNTVVPEQLIGYGRKSLEVQREVVLAIDQSGSMAESVVYASVFGAVLASMRTLRTSMVVFDTAVVDLTDQLRDPVEVLFGVQLGGGTDINRAVGYCQQLITRPEKTLFILISDLYEGGMSDQMFARMRAIKDSGADVVCLLALSDEGAPYYDKSNAATLAAMGIPAFACTPDKFPELLVESMNGGDLAAWAGNAF